MSIIAEKMAFLGSILRRNAAFFRLLLLLSKLLLLMCNFGDAEKVTRRSGLRLKINDQISYSRACR